MRPVLLPELSAPLQTLPQVLSEALRGLQQVPLLGRLAQPVTRQRGLQERRALRQALRRMPQAPERALPALPVG